MDPVTAFGTASAVISIIDALAKVITTISSLATQWTATDLAILSFQSQLAALQTGLENIKEWRQLNFQDQQAQLMNDIDRCLRCCGLLIEKLEQEFGQLQTVDGLADTGSKLRFLFKSKELQDIQMMIERQTSALNLLLTAYNRYGISQSWFRPN